MTEWNLLGARAIYQERESGVEGGTFMRIFLAVSALVVSGCVHVKTDPIEVEPIQITVDVYVKVDRALEDFFRDLDATSGTIEKE